MLQKAEEDVDFKVSEISRQLGETDHTHTKKYMMKFFQDKSSSAFPSPSIDCITSEYTKAVPDEDIEEVTESEEFGTLVNTLYTLSLYMHLSDPPLHLPITEDTEYKVFEKSEDFYCIDGFPVKNPNCAVVLPPVMRGNYIYQSIKPAVLILQQINLPLQNKENVIPVKKTTSLLHKRLTEAAKKVQPRSSFKRNKENCKVM